MAQVAEAKGKSAVKAEKRAPETPEEAERRQVREAVQKSTKLPLQWEFIAVGVPFWRGVVVVPGALASLCLEAVKSGRGWRAQLRVGQEIVQEESLTAHAQETEVDLQKRTMLKAVEISQSVIRSWGAMLLPAAKVAKSAKGPKAGRLAKAKKRKSK